MGATLALLIDGDNASPKIVAGLLAEVAKYGVAGVRRIYGDWTKPNLNGWKDCLLEHSIQPIQQFAYTTGKNATDGAMIIDARDLLYTARFDGFCIVSSDSDFARLAARIREQGVTVYGFGERKTPRPFVTACDKFVYFDVLNAPGEEAPATPAAQKEAKAKATKNARDETLLAMLRTVRPPERSGRSIGHRRHRTRRSRDAGRGFPASPSGGRPSGRAPPRSPDARPGDGLWCSATEEDRQGMPPDCCNRSFSNPAACLHGSARAVQRYLLKVIENMDLRPPRAAA